MSVSELNTTDLQDSFGIFLWNCFGNEGIVYHQVYWSSSSQSVFEEQLYKVEVLLLDSKNAFSV